MYNIIINNGSNIFSYIYNNIFYDELLKKNKDITNKIECLRQSYSFRFGRFITYIPRKIRDAIKYFKQYCFK